MGILRNGILGTMTGKVSGVVGSTWKGRNTLRAYAKPSNPKSASQVTQRGLFAFVVAVASLILETVVKPFNNPFASGISGFNDFCKRNLLLVSSSTDYAGLKVTEGNLEGAAITAAENNAGTVAMTFSQTIAGNGLLTDYAYGLVIDSGNDVAYISDGSDTRDDELVQVTGNASMTSAECHAYLFFVRGSGSSLMVSDSSYHTVADA
jgi:hypothetical protein